MSIDNSTLLSKIDIAGLQLCNRLAVAPMTRVSATGSGQVSETMVRYYERYARGGYGMVITEGIYTDQTFSQGYLFQPGLSDDAQARAWIPAVNAIRSNGAVAVAQLMHAGAISQGNRFRDMSVGPSAVQPRGKQMVFYYGKDKYRMPVAMTDEQIAEAVAGFGQSASRAVQTAGFDAVEIHGANGYLLDQFLTDYANLREDRWGGDTKGRIQLHLDVLKEVRRAVGGSVPVGIRISQGKVNDYFHKWKGGEQDAEIIFGSLNDAGADYIHVTEFEAWKPAFGETGPSLVELARKYAPKAKIIANGGLHDLEKAQAVLEAGADVTTFGRGALANPDLPNRLAAQQPLREFDTAILGPIANVKESELALMPK